MCEIGLFVADFKWKRRGAISPQNGVLNLYIYIMDDSLCNLPSPYQVSSQVQEN